MKEVRAANWSSFAFWAANWTHRSIYKTKIINKKGVKKEVEKKTFRIECVTITRGQNETRNM